MYKLIVILILLYSQPLFAQVDFYNELKVNYDKLRKENKQDSALLFAKKINDWALKNEGDTSLIFAVSFRYLGNCFASLKRNDSAIICYNLSLEYLKNQNRSEHPDYASSLNNLAIIYQVKADYISSERFHKQAIEIRRKALGEQHPDYASSLNNLGLLYSNMAEYKLAEPFYKKAMEIRKKYLGEQSPDYVSSLDNLANLYSYIGDYNTAMPFYIQAMKIRKKVLGEEHLDYATSLNETGILYSDMGDYKSAELYYKQAMGIRKKILGEENPDYASSLDNLGDLYKEMGDYRSAEPLIKLAMEIRKKVLGEEHPDYATSLNEIGILYSDMGDYKSAEFYYKQAMEVIKKTFGEQHRNYASSLNNLANLYKEMGDYRSAELYYKQAMEIRKKVLGEEHPDYASSLNNLANLFSEKGDYNLAELYYKQAMEIRKKVLGEEHPDYAASLNNLGILYFDKGDYKSAEILVKEAMEIRKNVLGEHNPDYASSLYRLGILYSDMGDYKSAEPFIKKAMEIEKKVHGEEHRSYVSSLNRLGILYFDIGDYNLAETYQKEAMEIKKKILGEEHPDYAFTLNNLANLYSYMGDYELAELYYKQAMVIWKKVFGEEHPSYASSLNNLGLLYLDIGDYTKAEPYYNQAIEIFKKTLGESHSDYLESLYSYAFVLQNTNRKKKAFEILNYSFSKMANQIDENFQWLNDKEKEAYWKKEKIFYEQLSNFSNEVFQEIPEAVGLNFNASLFTKSKLLETMIFINEKLRYEDKINFEAKLVRDELAYKRRLLVKLESEGYNEKSNFRQLDLEIDSLDNLLEIRWPEYAQQKRNLTITWNQVQKNLDNGEAAIEFVRFKNEDDSLYYYNALIVKKSDLFPTLVKLCKEKDLQLINPQMGYSAYYPLIFKPLEAVLKDVKTIYYAPVGELYNIPFHAIYDPKRKGDENVPEMINRNGDIIYPAYTKTEDNAEYLMDRYTLHQLTSTRYLAMGLKQKANVQIGNTIAMVGGVNYDYLPGVSPLTEKASKKSKQNRSSSYTSGKLAYLEETKTEVERINQSVGNVNWKTKILEYNEATEENITKLEGKEAATILHLATHGYAFPEYDFNDTTVSEQSLRYSYRYSSNSMVRSGLILAGGNWAWTGNDTLNKLGLQNGILTALEVSQLNLKKTNLVVLSACETGLGKIEGSEGTFGLKRGFKLAGVENLIVSLWSIPDKETMELMTLFYTDLTQSLNPIISFQNAQTEMRRRYPDKPFLWAGFVLVR